MDPEQAIELGQVLRQRRQDQGLTVRQLAERSGVNNATIVRIEQGKFAAPRPDKLSRIAEALGLPAADVFALADYTSPQELPALTPYLRTKYRDLPPGTVEKIKRYVTRVAKQDGLDLTGPEPGEDEQA